MSTTNLNQLVENILLRYEDSNLSSEVARREISSAILDAIMMHLDGLGLDIDDKCNCNCDCDCEDNYDYNVYLDDDEIDILDTVTQ